MGLHSVLLHVVNGQRKMGVCSCRAGVLYGSSVSGRRQVAGQGDAGEGSESVPGRFAQRRQSACPDAEQYLLQRFAYWPGVGGTVIRGGTEEVQSRAEVFAEG